MEFEGGLCVFGEHWPDYIILQDCLCKRYIECKSVWEEILMFVSESVYGLFLKLAHYDCENALQFSDNSEHI